MEVFARHAKLIYFKQIRLVMLVRLRTLECWEVWVTIGVWIAVCSLATSQPRIAVIGAGVGGAFNAYFARQFLGPAGDIDVYAYYAQTDMPVASAGVCLAVTFFVHCQV